MPTKARKIVMADNISVYCNFDELVDPVALIPNPHNPNKHSDAQVDLLARIIQAHGWRANITVSTRSGYVVRGHCRLLSALKLGAKQVPVEYQDYANEAEETADMVADNRIAEYSQVDVMELKELVLGLKGVEYDLTLTGYMDTELSSLVDETELDINTFLTDEKKPVKEHTVACPYCGKTFDPRAPKKAEED